MPGGVKLIDSTLVIVLHNGEREIERELASPADALRVALMMQARRGRLEIGDVLKVMARTERRWGRREKVHEPHAPTLLAERQNVSSCRRDETNRCAMTSVRFGLKVTLSKGGGSKGGGSKGGGSTGGGARRTEA
jgi:uncharacterized membrane protein YgcG